MDLKKRLWESKLVIALTMLIIVRCVDRVLYTRLTYDYGQFLWYLSNIILPLAFLISSWPVVWFKMALTNDITPEMRKFPHYKFAIMALFDAAYNFFSAFPTPHIGGNLANVLNQATLPFNMGFALIFLGTKYKRCHILGAILVLYGAMVDMIPVLKGDPSDNMPDPTLGWIALYVFSMTFSAGSNVYKELGLKDVDLDIWYVNAWVSFYQLLWGLFTLWTINIKAFCDPPVPLSHFFSYVSDAHNCFIGNPVMVAGELNPCDTGTLHVFLIFIIFNLAYNQLMLYIFKEGSSVLFVVSSAVCLPLTDLLYMVPLLTGKNASQAFTIYDGFALFVLVMGLLVYHSEKEQRVKGTRLMDKSPMFASPSLQRTHLMKRKRDRIFYHQSPRPQRPSDPSPRFGRKGGYGAVNNESEV